MRTYVLTQLSDAALCRSLEVAISRDRTTTAEVLAHIAEFDTRRLYLPAGFPSMRAYCVGKLRLSEDCAYKRIQAARAARQFPAIFSALADGRIHLAAVCLLAPHLRLENAGELLTAATHRTKSDVQLLVAQRFPRTEMMTLVQTIPALPTQLNAQLAPGQVVRPGQGSRRSSTNPRHIPAHVKRAVRERDHGRCTFVSETG